MIPAKTVIAKIVVVANVVPHSYAPNVESNEQLPTLNKLRSKEIPNAGNDIEATTSNSRERTVVVQ